MKVKEKRKLTEKKNATKEKTKKNKVKEIRSLSILIHS